VRGDIDARVAAPVALGSVVGVIVGARVLMAVSSERVRLMLVAVLVLLAIQMALAAAGIDVVRGLP
jgi:uncharacterized membrane protein YfcA